VCYHQLMGRTRVLVTVLVIASASAFVAPSTASAVTPTVTVTPSVGLVNGESVTVNGSGWQPSSVVSVYECVLVSGDDVECVTSQPVGTDPAGDFAIPYTVVRMIHGIDCQAAGGCAIVAFTSPSTTISAAAITFVDPAKPDVVIRRRSDGKLFFDNIYTSTPTPYGHTIAPGGTWTFAVLVQNDGGAPGDFTVTADSVAAPFSIEYASGYFNLTSSVTGGGVRVSAVAPNTFRVFAVQFRADPGTPIGATASITLTATANADPALHDAVKLLVKASA
jgi:Neocarzinostatin family